MPEQKTPAELNIMIDIETLGSGADAAILSIGAVPFIAGEVFEFDTFHDRINLQSCIDAGLQIDAHTFYWWLQQSVEARKSIIVTKEETVDYKQDRHNLYNILYSLNQWTETLFHLLKPNYETLLWGNGANFDNKILSHAYRVVDLKPFWHYRNDRCYRTLAALYPDVKKPDPEIEHNALHDAVAQAKHAAKILKIHTT